VRCAQDGLGKLALVRHVGHVPVSMSCDAVRDLSAADALDRRLAGRVDLGHEHPICLVEGRGELREQGARPRVPVRLEDGNHLPPEAVLGRVERRLDLGRMVRRSRPPR